MSFRALLLCSCLATGLLGQTPLGVAERDALRSRLRAAIDRELEASFARVRDRLFAEIDLALGEDPRGGSSAGAVSDVAPAAFEALAWTPASEPRSEDSASSASAKASWTTFSDERLRVTTVPVSSECRRLHGLAEGVGHRVTALAADSPLLATSPPVQPGDLLLLGRFDATCSGGEVWRIHRLAARDGRRGTVCVNVPTAFDGALPRTDAGRRELIEGLLRRRARDQIGSGVVWPAPAPPDTLRPPQP